MNGVLSADDFPIWFAAANGGKDPFPWQRDLATEVIRTGLWPQSLEVPTGAGKTAVIDIAVFAMAVLDDHPRRVAVVVDRRIIVSQAAERALALQTLLRSPSDPIVVAVADGLRRLVHAPSDVVPLQVAELRGGILRDDEWAARPDVPAIIVSTVDQVGSRLLFRGYGVSRAMNPIHTGLLGTDLLLILDEAHLARPFERLARSLAMGLGPSPTTNYLRGPGLPARWACMTMSATLGDEARRQTKGTRPWGPHAAANEAHPTLGPRLRASKPVERRLVKGDRERLVVEATDAATALVASGCLRVGIVVNRVASAVGIAERLGGHADLDMVLLTGRMRPWDRDVQLADPSIRARLLASEPRRPDARPLVLVATQAVEAGADFDLDVLVTECASWDALVQRFGRVDRFGERTVQGLAAMSVILALGSDVKNGEDPVYGSALAATWAHLAEANVTDMGAGRAEPAGGDCYPPHRPSPQLLLSHLDRLAQTAPAPDADIDPAPFLHGFKAGQPEVQVLWRAELDLLMADGIRPAADAPEDEHDRWIERLRDAVGSAAPRAGEAVAVPLGAARRWLSGRDPGELSDAPANDTGGDDRLPSGPRVYVGLVWDGAESRLFDASSSGNRLRPGDTVVLPCGAGGLAHGTWHAAAVAAVDEAAPPADPNESTGAAGTGPARAASRRRHSIGLLLDLVGDRIDEAELADSAGRAVDLAPPVGQPASARARAEAVEFAEARWRAAIVLLRSDGHEAALDRLEMVWARAADATKADLTVDSEDDTSSFLGAEIGLDRHLLSVEAWARGLAHAVGLDAALVDDLALAGRIHDLGKVDPRFQALLARGLADPVRLLAKSATAASDTAGRRAAARQAGYPRGERHELLSVALVEGSAELEARAHDWQLVLHLVASHHGHARPFVPAATTQRWPIPPTSVEIAVDGIILRGSTAHRMARLASGIPERFFAVQERFGWYGLAYLEAILRLADHRASEADARNPEERA